MTEVLQTQDRVSSMQAILEAKVLDADSVMECPLPTVFHHTHELLERERERERVILKITSGQKSASLLPICQPENKIRMQEKLLQTWRDREKGKAYGDDCVDRTRIHRDGCHRVTR